MEDVKEHKEAKKVTDPILGFNPCFNGRCKRTELNRSLCYLINSVSILVLMEDVKELHL